MLFSQTIVQELKSLMENDTQFTVPILDALSNLNLQPELIVRPFLFLSQSCYVDKHPIL